MALIWNVYLNQTTISQEQCDRRGHLLKAEIFLLGKMYIYHKRVCEKVGIPDCARTSYESPGAEDASAFLLQQKRDI